VKVDKEKVKKQRPAEYFEPRRCRKCDYETEIYFSHSGVSKHAKRIHHCWYNYRPRDEAFIPIPPHLCRQSSRNCGRGSSTGVLLLPPPLCPPPVRRLLRLDVSLQFLPAFRPLPARQYRHLRRLPRRAGRRRRLPAAAASLRLIFPRKRRPS